MLLDRMSLLRNRLSETAGQILQCTTILLHEDVVALESSVKY